MKKLFFAQIVVMMLGIGFAAVADGVEVANPAGSAKVTINTGAAAGEVRNYKIDVVTKGKMPMPDSDTPMDIDTKVSLKVQHKYGKPGSDGLLPLEITATDVQIYSDGQKVDVPPDTYPKLDVTFGKNWVVKDIKGIDGTRYAQSLPGINYGNMIIVFYPAGVDVSRLPGEMWKSTVILPPNGDTYQFSNTMVSEREVDGAKTAAMRETINWVPKSQDFIGSSVTAVANNIYDTKDGKLISSHIESTVTFGDQKQESNKSKKKAATSQQDKNAYTANTKIDIVLIK